MNRFGKQARVLRGVAWCLGMVALLACAGCNGAEMQQARREHIIAGDHGWIDITLKAPAAAAREAKKGRSDCMLTLLVNGERYLNEFAPLVEADADQTPIGYRFVAAAGKLKLTLALDACVKKESVTQLDLPLEKDHLARVLFDGSALVLQGATAYEPASLDSMRAEIAKLQARGSASDESLSTLTRLAAAIIALNLVGLLVMVWRRRR